MPRRAGRACAGNSRRRPRRFLQAIYKPYSAKNYPGQAYQDANRCFVPGLARAMKADTAAAARRDDVPLLNGDLFVDTQDWEIINLAIAVVPRGSTAATGGSLCALYKGR